MFIKRDNQNKSSVALKGRLNGADRHSTECGEGTVIMLLDCLINVNIQNKRSAV